MRIKAFTLLEITLALVLTSLLLITAFSVLNNFQLFSNQYSSSSQEARALLELDAFLRHDAGNASDFQLDSSKLLLINDTGKITATYTVTAGELVRNSSDTIRLSFQGFYRLNEANFRINFREGYLPRFLQYQIIAHANAKLRLEPIKKD